MKNFYNILIVILFFATHSSVVHSQTIDPSEWDLVFDENFDSLSVSANGPCGPGGTTWMAHTPYYGDFGCYMADPDKIAPNFPFTVDDGILRIEARLTGSDPCVTWGDWHSGLLSTSDPNRNGFFQQYGYFECRAKMPPGPGTWPAFWLNSWQGAEIDIIEHYGHDPGKFHTVLHDWENDWHDSPPVHDVCEMTNDYRSCLTEEYHTYGLLITPANISFYFDRNEIWRTQTPASFQNVDYYVLVNLSLGSGWSTCETPDPSYMYVDYVKVWDLGENYNKAPVINIISPENNSTFSEGESITIVADASDIDGSVSTVEFYQNGRYLGQDDSEPFSFTWDNVPSGAFKLTAIATDNEGVFASSPAVNIAIRGNLPDPWFSQDIGEVGVPGTVTEVSGNFSIKGSGADIWETSDGFYYVYQPLSGDGEITARIRSIEDTNEWAKAGVMIRETLEGGSKHALMAMSSQNGAAFQRRTSTNGASEHTAGSTNSTPRWVKVQRRGNTFTGYESSSGSEWTKVDEAEINMAEDVYIGLAVTSHNDGVLCRSNINNVAVVSGSTFAGKTLNQPKRFALFPAFPNPFNPSTTIRFELASPERTSVRIFDILGHHIATLIDKELHTGQHAVVWDGSNDLAEQVSSGTYFVQFKVGNFSQLDKVVLLR